MDCLRVSVYAYLVGIYIIEKLKQEEGNACRKRACLIEFRKIKPNRQAPGFMPLDIQYCLHYFSLLVPWFSLLGTIRYSSAPQPPSFATVHPGHSSIPYFDMADICLE